MNTIDKKVIITLALLLFAGAAWAQNDPDGPDRRRRGDGDDPRVGRRRGEGEGGPRQRGVQSGPPWMAVPLEQDEALGMLDLTKQQKSKIAEIMQIPSQRRREMGKAMRDAQQGMREASESGDEQAIKAARERLEEVREQSRQLTQELIRKVNEVLTRPQRAQLIKLLAPGGGFYRLLVVVRSLDLTPAQQRTIREIAAKTDADLKVAGSRQDKEKVSAEAQTKVMELLTDEQKLKVQRQMATQASRRGGEAAILEQLNLTEEQQRAIEAIRADNREQAGQGDTRDARRETMLSGRRRIFNEVLTDEQKEQYRELLQQQRRRGDPDGGGGEGERRRGRGGREPNAGNGEDAP